MISSTTSQYSEHHTTLTAYDSNSVFSVFSVLTYVPTYKKKPINPNLIPDLVSQTDRHRARRRQNPGPRTSQYKPDLRLDVHTEAKAERARRVRMPASCGRSDSDVSGSGAARGCSFLLFRFWVFGLAGYLGYFWCFPAVRFCEVRLAGCVLNVNGRA